MVDTFDKKIEKKTKEICDTVRMRYWLNNQLDWLM